jgi:hypothetical protein
VLNIYILKHKSLHVGLQFPNNVVGLVDRWIAYHTGSSRKVFCKYNQTPFLNSGKQIKYLLNSCCCPFQEWHDMFFTLHVYRCNWTHFLDMRQGRLPAKSSHFKWIKELPSHITLTREHRSYLQDTNHSNSAAIILSARFRLVRKPL